MTHKPMFIITYLTVLHIALGSQRMSQNTFILGIFLKSGLPLELNNTTSLQYPSCTLYHFHRNIWCDTRYTFDGYQRGRIKILGT